MSLLDPLLQGATDLAPIQTQLAAIQAVTNAQQALIDALSTQFEGLGEAQSAVDAIQSNAIAAAEAVNIAQTAAQTALQAAQDAAAAVDASHSSAITAVQTAANDNAIAITALQTSSGEHGTAIATARTDIDTLIAQVPDLSPLSFVDLRRFVPGRVLTDANIDDAIDAAIVYAMSFTGPGFQGPAPIVKAPAGKWTLSRGHVFPAWATGQNRCVIGFRGESMNETIFLASSDATGTPVFTFGTGTTAELNPWTMYLRVGGFSIIAANGDDTANRCGIRVYCAVNPLLNDIRVRGFSTPDATYTQGRGLEILPATGGGVEINSQFAVVKDCDFSLNMTGVYVRLSYPILLDNVHAQGNAFQNAIFQGCMGEWRNSGVQYHGNTSYYLDRWYGGRNMPPIVTGFSSTTGLASGTGATCGAASSNVCLVTGLTGLNALIDRGRWLELTPAGTTPNELKVRGVYKIDRVVSATSCYIRKGSNHTSQGSLAWQVRQADANAEMVFDNLYDEGHRIATYGFYRDFAGAGNFVVRRPLSIGVDFTVETDGPFRVRVEAPAYANTNKVARVWLTKESHIDALPSRIEVDDFSYPGHASRSGWQRGLVGTIPSDERTPYAYRDSGGGYAVRARTALQEMGFVEIWDTRITSSITIVGTEARAMVGLLRSSPLAPKVAGQYPLYDPHDPLLGGPCIANVPGNHLLGGSLRGTIAAAHLPTHPYLCTIVVVSRLEDGTVLGSDPRRVQVSTTDASQFIAFNDGQWIGTGNYVMNEGPAFGNALTALVPAVDTEPHVHIFGRHPDGLNAISSDNGEDYRANNAAAVLTASHTVGADLNIIIGDGGVSTHAFRWSLVAVKCGTLSQAEARRLVDLCRNEWPLEA